MKPQSAKAKGRKLQQLVRDFILEIFPDLTERDVKSTGMGQAGDDIQLSEKGFQRFSYAVECKSMAKVAIYKWFRQRSPKEGNILLVVKQNHEEPLAVVTLKHFMELISGQKSDRHC